MQKLLVLFLLVFLLACDDEQPTPPTPGIRLDSFLADNFELTKLNLIACAVGRPGGLHPNSSAPTDVIYFPEGNEGEAFYFESDDDLANPGDQSKYFQQTLNEEPLFNGHLRQLNRPAFTGEKWATVLFQTGDSLYISQPIKLKTNTEATEVNASLINIMPNGTMPSFTWQNGIHPDNAIYFNVVSDTDGNLISGTYTWEQQFTFLDLSNINLYVHADEPEPILIADKDYVFTLMTVNSDNWVILFGELPFTAE